MSGIVLKPANRAAQLYVGGSGVQQAVRQQHQYVLVYNLYPIREDDFLDEKIGYLKEFRDRLHFLCNTVDGPKFQIQQDVLVQLLQREKRWKVMMSYITMQEKKIFIL